MCFLCTYERSFIRDVFLGVFYSDNQNAVVPKLFKNVDLCDNIKRLFAAFVFARASPPVARKDFRETWLEVIPKEYHAEIDHRRWDLAMKEITAEGRTIR